MVARACVLILLLFPAAAQRAHADGAFFDKMGAATSVSEPAQKAVILRDGAQHEILLLQTTYHGSAAEFAWVVPVPSLPARGDVFLALPYFIQRVEETTAPRTRTVLHDPLVGRGAWGPREQRDLVFEPPGSFHGGMMGPPPGPGGPAPPPVVVVHERMAVGEYDVSVLSATGPGVLAGWLRKHGYAFPAHAGPIADDYVRRGWKFVALRIRPKIAQRRPTLADVAPIGIRFRATPMIYPLAISKASAPEISSMLLIVVGKKGVGCSELPVEALPKESKVARGTTYRMAAREQLRRHAGKALLCEARGPTTADLQYGASTIDVAGTHKLELKSLVATRFWAELPRDAMQDLTFPPMAGDDFHLECSRSARVPAPAWAYCFGTNAARLIWKVLAFALILTALWPRKAPNLEYPAAARLSRAVYTSAALLGGVVLLAIVVVPELRDASPEDYFSPAGVVLQAILAAAIVPAGLLLRWLIPRMPRALWKSTGRVVGLVALAIAGVAWVVGTAYLAGRPDANLLLLACASLGVGALCIPPIVAALYTVSASSRRASIWRRVFLAFVLAVLLAPTMDVLCDMAISPLPTAQRLANDQESARSDVEKAVRQFREATGANPRQLADLCARQAPATGVDASGNAVPLAAGPRAPLLQEVPVDPFTGRRDDWVYDTRAAGSVESGAYTLEVKTVAGSLMW